MSQLLTTKYKPPLLLSYSEEYDIYVDESIAFQRYDEQALPKLFVTAFCVISSNQLKQFNRNYGRYVYKSQNKSELKSTQVSDRLNRNILRNSKRYLVKSLIFSRPAKLFNSFEHNKQALSLALELRSYIAPIENLIKSIKINPSASRVKFNVFIDQTSRNNINPYANYNNELLEKIAAKLSTKKLKFEITYKTVDSKKSYGVQLADMLAGAYRKEKYYFNEKIKIIPFSYLLLEGEENLKEDKVFLQLFGYVAYTRLLLGPDAEELPALQFSQQVGYSIKRLGIRIKKLCTKFITRHSLSSTVALTHKTLEDCDNLESAAKRKLVLVEINTLNKILRQIALTSGLNVSDFIFQFSNKVKDKSYHKTISNILFNIENVQKVVKEDKDLGSFTRGLKYFNRNVALILRK